MTPMKTIKAVKQ